MSRQASSTGIWVPAWYFNESYDFTQNGPVGPLSLDIPITQWPFLLHMNT